MNHIWSFEKVKECSFYVDGPRTCQTCLTPNKCNTFTKAHTDTVEYNHLNRCRNLNNDLIPCSDIWSQCYLYVDRVEETYLAAGCVEPTTNLTILTSPDTLLCLGNYFPYESCFDLRRSYSNRLSCFKCNDKTFFNNCNDPGDLDVSAREMCPEGIRACVTYVQGKKVMGAVMIPTEIPPHKHVLGIQTCASTARPATAMGWPCNRIRPSATPQSHSWGTWTAGSYG